MRHTSKSLGVSVALPPEWGCINHDPDAKEQSIAALKVKMKNDSFGLFDIVISDMFSRSSEVNGLHCLYDPDMNTFMGGTYTMLTVEDCLQSGFTSALSIAMYDQECTPYTFTVQGRDAASALCVYPEGDPPIKFRVDVLDGPRHIQMEFRTYDQGLAPQFEMIRDSLRLE